MQLTSKSIGEIGNTIDLGVNPNSTARQVPGGNVKEFGSQQLDVIVNGPTASLAHKLALARRAIMVIAHKEGVRIDAVGVEFLYVSGFTRNVMEFVHSLATLLA